MSLESQSRVTSNYNDYDLESHGHVNDPTLGLISQGSSLLRLGPGLFNYSSTSHNASLGQLHIHGSSTYTVSVDTTLLFVCRAIDALTASLLYCNNTFVSIILVGLLQPHALLSRLPLHLRYNYFYTKTALQTRHSSSPPTTITRVPYNIARHAQRCDSCRVYSSTLLLHVTSIQASHNTC